MNLTSAFSAPYLAFRAVFQLARAQRRGLPGAKFGWFGIKIGARVAIRAPGPGMDLILNPVSIVRYYEFPFAIRHVKPGLCLDVASPRLFSLFIASKDRDTRIRVLNPDPQDVARTSLIATCIGVGDRVKIETKPVDAMFGETEQYDCIYAISVLEHIYGEYDERDALPQLWKALKPEGKLVVTVPADRKFWTEYRSENLYDTQTLTGDDRFFFQRLYDESAIQERIIDVVGEAPVEVRWFGEKTRGNFREWEEHVAARGVHVVVNDSTEILNHYREFPNWANMPGLGICCLAFEKRQNRGHEASPSRRLRTRGTQNSSGPIEKME